MPIGTSSGEYFEDRFEYVANLPRVYITGETEKELSGADDNVIPPPEPNMDPKMLITPDQLEGNLEMQKDPSIVWDDQGQIQDYDFSKGRDVLRRMPPQASTEPADALKPEGGSQTPGNNPETNFFNRLSIVKPIQGMLKGPNLEEDKAVLKGLWESIKSGFTLPGDVAQGKIDVGSVQTVERALDLAGLAVLGPAPVAAKMADGSLGSFMGVRSQSIDKTKLYKAQNMELQGAHPDDIWKETGTFRGADGRWRQEIPDTNAKLKESAFDKEVTLGKQGEGWTSPGTSDVTVWSPKAKGWLEPPTSNNPEEILSYLFRMSKPETKEFMRLDEVLDHPELFKAYPELRNMQVAELPKKFRDEGIMGQVSGKTLFLAPGDPEYLKSVIMHEIQHGIQAVEGFARGGNSREFMSPKLQAAGEQFAKVKADTVADIVAKGRDPEVVRYVTDLYKFAKDPDLPNREAWLNQIKSVEDKWKTLGWGDDLKRLKDIGEGQSILDKESARQLELYRRLAGEVEARNVQTRLGIAPEFLSFELAAPSFKEAGIALDMTYGRGNIRDSYKLRKWGTKEEIDPSDLPENLKRVWKDLNEGYIPSPRSTEDRPRFVQQKVEQTERIQHK